MDTGHPLTWAQYSVAVYQASGMVSARADCTCAEAVGMMKERAHVEHQTLAEIADAVVERNLRFGA